MEWLQGLLESSQWPVLTAFILGLMTAISPCPLATNITAIAFIGKDITEKRTVLLKGIDARGLSFFTNLTSRKSREINENPFVSVTFPWYALHRQVTVGGAVELLPREEVITYFNSRPRESQLGAWASEQSAVIDSRQVLEDRYRESEARYQDAIPVPDHWGGWLIRPTIVEFWQGRPSRLHDRLRFRSVDGFPTLDHPAGWAVDRLSP